MWYASDDINGLQNIRHSCETGDDLASHAWIEYDPRVGGKQIIKDRQNDIALETEFYKSEDGAWIARIKGTPLRGAKQDPITTIVFYTGLEGPGYVKLAKPQLTRKGLEGDIEFDGLSPDLGKFRLLVTDGPKTNKHPISEHPLEERRPSSNSHYASLDFPGNAWRARDVFLTFVQDSFNEIAEEYGMETVVCLFPAEPRRHEGQYPFCSKGVPRII
jgi:mannosyl-oligosaccharide glucosidase